MEDYWNSSTLVRKINFKWFQKFRKIVLYVVLLTKIKRNGDKNENLYGRMKNWCMVEIDRKFFEEFLRDTMKL